MTKTKSTKRPIFAFAHKVLNDQKGAPFLVRLLQHGDGVFLYDLDYYNMYEYYNMKMALLLFCTGTKYNQASFLLEAPQTILRRLV